MTSSTSFDHNFLFTTLHHKTNRSRNLEVRIVHDDSIAPPSLLNGNWVAPYDVVGLNSKKAKFVKLRYHSSMQELSRMYQQLTETASKEARKYLSALIADSEWSFHEPADNRPTMIRKIATFLFEKTGYVTISRQSFLINWVLSSENICKKRSLETLKDVQNILQHNHLVNSFTVTVTNQDDNIQVVELSYCKGELTTPVLKLVLENSSLLPGDHPEALRIFDHGIELRLLFLSNDVDYKPVPLIASCVVFIEKQEKQKMLDAGQLRVEALRKRLDESLAFFQKSAVQKDRKARSLHIVRVNPKEAMVEIGEHGARPRLDRILSSSSPLNVICDGSAMGDLATSPAESIDSGVGLSPVTSPVGKHSPFYQYSEENRLGMRQRSASESEWASEGLKGILKKPSPRPRRLSRSVSESCHGLTLGPFGLIGTLEEEDEEYAEEADYEGQSDENVSIAPRKKRVSFSEKLEQCRRFRPNQCIASQARKNEKRRLHKRRKEEERRRLSCGSESEGSTCSEAKPCLRNERQDSGFVDKDDTPPSSPLPTEESAWSGLIRQQRKMAAI